MWRLKQVGQVQIEADDEPFAPVCSPRWEIQQLMNVELVPSASSDNLDPNLFSNKHSASRLGRHKPPFAASRLHQLLIGLFSPADETSLAGREAMSTRRIGEEGAEGRGKGSHF